MPIEILELVVKAKVTETDTSPQTNHNTSGTQPTQASLAPIEKAVQEVMEILKRKNER
jgi:hypothetical protein